MDIFGDMLMMQKNRQVDLHKYTRKGGTSMQNDYKRFDIVMVDIGENKIG